MTSLYSPAAAGFDPRFDAVDRCQVALLRELAAQQDGRLILKGGMAMRAAFGSLRLTKDIDFDRHESLSQEALKKGLTKMLVRAAGQAGLREPRAEITKDTRTTVRARLEGLVAAGAFARFEVEVSGRTPPSAQVVRKEIVTPPREYGMAPFPVMVYTDEALAAMKIAAALSDQRNAPRDLYDLSDLIRAGADPTALLARQDAELLRDYASRSLGKLEMLNYVLAQQELLPFIPPATRAQLSEDAWLDMTLMVSERIQLWCEQALQLQVQAQRSQAEQEGQEPSASPRNAP